MAEPFKNLFNHDLIEMMALHFQRHQADFDQDGFIAMAAHNLESLELKARSEQITQAMVTYLPEDFVAAVGIMLASLRPVNGEDLFGLIADDAGLVGWAILPMTHYVGRCGQQHHSLSMTVLKEMTKRFSSEFGIRFFLLAAQEETMQTLQQWISDPDRHVRRLISEGTRPRLPWAMQLPMFLKDPQPVIELLEQLKDDPEEYVRRSVANNLNDIAKDHPDLVAGLALDWMQGADNNRIKLIRHACRTLLKQGNKKALEVFGFAEPQLHPSELSISNASVTVGEHIEFTFTLSSAITNKQELMIDYVIHHQKKNGSTSPKVFKWKKLTLKPEETLTLTKQHSFKVVTTRVYYSGDHAVEIIVNGIAMAKKGFCLQEL